MEDFDALVQSLGESTVDYLGKDRLRQLQIMADHVTGTANIEICLEDNTWESQTRAIERMIEIRDMFLDEISISYVFVDEDTCMEKRSHAHAPEYSFA